MHSKMDVAICQYSPTVKGAELNVYNKAHIYVNDSSV